MCARSKVVIPGLLRKIKQLEDELVSINTHADLSTQQALSDQSVGEDMIFVSDADCKAGVQHEDEVRVVKSNKKLWVVAIVAVLICINKWF